MGGEQQDSNLRLLEPQSNTLTNWVMLAILKTLYVSITIPNGTWTRVATVKE